MQEYYSNSSNLFNQFTLPFIPQQFVIAIRNCYLKFQNEASIFECHSSSLDLKHEIVYFDATISS